MNIIRVTIIAALLGAGFQMIAQPHEYWQPIDVGIISGLTGDLQYSENFNLLVFSGGHGTSTESGDVLGFLGGFDGEQWITLTEDIAMGLRTFVDFEQGLLFGGGTPFIGGQYMPNMAYFDGEEWSFPYEFNGDINKLKWVNDTLYALGWFTEIDGNEAYRVAALVDGVWEGRMSPDMAQYIPGWQLGDIEYYNGEVYISGNFQVLPNEQSGNLDGLIRAFGKLSNGWIVKPTEEFYFLGSGGISNMVVYQDQLYLAGATSASGTGAGHAIHRFDGSSISPVPHPPRYWWEEYQVMTIGGVVKMLVNDDYLYVGGEFNHMGTDTHTGKVARWDGNQWCGLFATEFQDTFKNMAFLHDQLVIVNPYIHEYEYPFPHNSYWIYTGGDAVSNCTEPLSTSAHNHANDLTLHPNPAHTHTTLSSAQQPMERLALYDLQGRLVHEAQPAALSYRIPLAGLPPGVYVLQVQVGSDVVRKKVVVE